MATAVGDGTVFSNAFADILNSELGDDATYTPSGGSATAIRVLYHEDWDPALGMEAYDVYVEALSSDVTGAAPGDTLLVKGTTYKVKGPPHGKSDIVTILFLSED